MRIMGVYHWWRNGHRVKAPPPGLYDLIYRDIRIDHKGRTVYDVEIIGNG
jgi:hypothetical protein